MATKGLSVKASDFNTVRNKIAQVLGSGGTNPVTTSGDEGFGYGQSLSSSEVDPYDDITKNDMNNLRSDIIKARAHQTNTTVTLPVFDEGSSISASEFNKFDTEATNAINNKFIAHANRMVVETRTDGKGTQDTMTNWNATHVHEVRVEFRNRNEFRYFFNTGGEIRIQPSISSWNTRDTKNVEWADLLNNQVKLIRFTYNQTICSGSAGTVTNIGAYGLSTTYQSVFLKSGTANYSQSSYQIRVKRNNNGDQIFFEITFNDGEVDESSFETDRFGTQYYAARPDELITGTTRSELSQLRAYNSNSSYVSVEGPIAYTTLLNIP